MLAWLRCKLRRLRGALLAKQCKHFAAMDDASLTAYAVGLLGEYLSEAWLQRLCDSCGISLAGAALYSGAHYCLLATVMFTGTEMHGGIHSLLEG